MLLKHVPEAISAAPSLTRVLYTHSTAFIGGGNRVLLDLFEGLDRSRFQPISLIPERGPLEVELCRLQVPYICLDIRPKHGSHLLQIRQIMWLVFYNLKFGIRMVHANDPLTYRYASIAARWSGVTCVCHVHHPGGTREFFNWAFRLPPKLIFTPSLFMKREVSSRLANTSKIRVETVWNHVNTEWFAPTSDLSGLRHQLGVDPLGKHVSIIAALTPHKGHICFLRMAKSVLNSWPRTTFHVVGSPKTGTENHAKSLMRLAEEMGISKQVRFWGFVPDQLARDILRVSDLFILPTHEEGFGLVLAEAQSCQVPVLTSSISPLDEVVANGRTGYLINQEDHEAFAKTAIKLLECDGIRKKMGTAGRERIVNRFSHNAHVTKIMSLYQDVLSEH